MKIVTDPFNTTTQGLAMTLTAVYYKKGCTDLVSRSRGRQNCHTATGVIEYLENDKDSTNEHDC